MAENKTETKATETENPRKAIREARLARLKVIEGVPKTINVYPANETLRMIMRHPNGTAFQSTVDQPVAWPIDGFTTRRIAEGSVLTEPGSGGGKEVEADPTTNAREQAAVNKPKPKAEGKDGGKDGKPAPSRPQHPSPPSAA